MLEQIVLEKIGVIIVVRVYRRGGGTGGFRVKRGTQGLPGAPGGGLNPCGYYCGCWPLGSTEGSKREPASPGGPGGSQGTLLGVVWGSFRVNFVSVEADLGSDLVVCLSNYYYYYFVNNINNYY